MLYKRNFDDDTGILLFVSSLLSCNDLRERNERVGARARGEVNIFTSSNIKIERGWMGFPSLPSASIVAALFSDAPMLKAVSKLT